MAARQRAETKPDPAEPVDAATAPQTEDYTRRAGGWVLTERGWVLEGKGSE